MPVFKSKMSSAQEPKLNNLLPSTASNFQKYEDLLSQEN